jgi:uncharacterized membrane protein YadS
MARQDGIGVKAALPALVGSCLLGAGAYFIGRNAYAASIQGVAAAVILFVLIGFPNVAYRQLGGRQQSSSDRVRRSLRRLFAFGVVIFGVGLLLDSLALVALAVAFLAFWFVFILVTRRKVRG